MPLIILSYSISRKNSNTVLKLLMFFLIKSIFSGLYLKKLNENMLPIFLKLNQEKTLKHHYDSINESDRVHYLLHEKCNIFVKFTWHNFVKILPRKHEIAPFLFFLFKGECSVFFIIIIMDENVALSEYNKIPLDHNRTNGAVYSKIYFKVQICSV